MAEVARRLGVKGHRPVIGTRDGKDVLYVFAVLNRISGALHTNTLESLRKENRKSDDGKTRRMQRAFADYLRHVGRVYPQDKRKDYRTKLILPAILTGHPFGVGHATEEPRLTPPG